MKTATGARDSVGSFRREAILTLLAIVVTAAAALLLAGEVGAILFDDLEAGAPVRAVEQIVFIAIVFFLIYGNLVYQVSRLGAIRRWQSHRSVARDTLERIYEGAAPPLTVLVPSYREEELVIWQTLLSAALMEYPHKRIVLLIDDPPNPDTTQAARALATARELPPRLAAVLEPRARDFELALSAHLSRGRGGPLDVGSECRTLAGLYDEAAQWLEDLAAEAPDANHTDRFVVTRILMEPAKQHRERAATIRRWEEDEASHRPSPERLEREYRRLATMFRCEITSFERKRYVNMPHEANKAMNLNAYISLIGGRYREVHEADGLHLVPTEGPVADLVAPPAEFLVTLDADSALLHDYALRLVHVAQLPENARLAVVQTPYSAYPGTDNLLERLAGSTTDVQHVVHQGFTRYAGTYWVGANALVRLMALRDVAQQGEERGFPVTRWIQDRTVIEDTESTVDLIARGWQLHNYPDRLAYSATPPDFGALVIQRRRWANGGLIILPKLVRFRFRATEGLLRLGEAFVRIHYLVSPAGVSLAVLLLILYPFEESMRSLWLPLTALPYFALYSRDQAFSGYRWTDIFGVYALNLLLMPVNLGGVAKSLQQAATGRKTPFGRTPKVATRTAVQPLYLLAPAAITLYCMINAVVDFAFGRWAHALFAAFNGAFFAYALVYLVGLPTLREDLLGSWTTRQRPGTLSSLKSGASETPAVVRFAAGPRTWSGVSMLGRGASTRRLRRS